MITTTDTNATRPILCRAAFIDQYGVTPHFGDIHRVGGVLIWAADENGTAMCL